MQLLLLVRVTRQELGGDKQAAVGVRRSHEGAVGQQQQAAAGGAPEEVAGGQLQAERVPAGGTPVHTDVNHLTGGQRV